MIFDNPTVNWLIGPSSEPTPHRVLPGLGVREDTLLPLLDIDLTATGRADWPPHAILLGYHAYDYRAARDEPWPEFWLDHAAALAHEVPRSFFFEDELLRPGERDSLTEGFATMTPVSEPADVWDAAVRFGPNYGILLEKPLWLPSDMPRPTDPDGTPMVFLGQFAAGEISVVMPSFTYWLYWSPARRVFAQLDEHD